MRTQAIKRFFSFMMCMVMLMTCIGMPALAEGTEVPVCNHSTFQFRQEPGVAASCAADGSSRDGCTASTSSTWTSPI